MDQAGFFELMGFGPQGWGKPLLIGTMMTLLIAGAGFVLGACLGVWGAWAKLSGGKAARRSAETYTTVLRGVPDLLVIYFVYFGGSAAMKSLGELFGVSGIGLPGFIAGTLAIGVCSGAQHTEVFRGAYQAVDRGEIEAGLACGMSPILRFRRIILPLALRHALPGLGNVWQVVLKESALISVVGMTELMRQTNVAAGSTNRHFEFYAIALLIYFAISICSGAVLQNAEHRFSRGVRRG